MREALRLPRSAALAALLALAVAGTGCGSDGEPTSSGQARRLLERSLEGQSTVKSGELKVVLRADLEGVRSLSEPLALSLEGPFRSNGRGRPPNLDWDVSFDGAGQQLSGGLTSTANNAFLRFEGRAYELGEAAFAWLAERLRLAHTDKPLTSGPLGLDPASWLEDPELRDGEPIGGEQTRKVTGSVDVRKAVRDLVDLMRSPAVRRELGRSGSRLRELAQRDLEQVEDAIDEVDVELNVDRDDVVRRLLAEVELNAEDDGQGEDVKGKLSFLYVLGRIGTNRPIEPPADARPLRELIGGLGLGALGGGLRRR